MKLTYISLALVVQSLIVFSVCAATSIPKVGKTLTFEQAVSLGTSLKGCPKKFITKVDSAYLVDETGNPNPGRTAKPIFMILSIDAASSSPMVGPMANVPTDEQLATVKGKKVCNTPDE